MNSFNDSTTPPTGPRPSGKGRSPAAVPEERSDGAQPVQTNANKVNPQTPAELYAERLESAELRRSTRAFSGLNRVQKCCHTVRREAGTGMVMDYQAKPENRVSGFRGLYTCGSVWACDRCQALIQRQRFLDVWKAMDLWTTKGATIATQYRDYGPEGKDGMGLLWENEGEFEDGNHIQGPAGYIDAKNGGIVWPGVNDANVETGEMRNLRRFNLVDVDVKHRPGGLGFMTLTMRHQAATKAGSKWAANPIWSAESAAFKVFTNGKFFKGNIHAYQRSVEVQWSPRAGWHVHIHVSLFVSKGFRRTMAANKKALFSAWQAAVELQGYEAEAPGFDLRMVTDLEESARKLAQYVAKGSGTRSLAAEMTQSGKKKSVYSISPGQMRQRLHGARMGVVSEPGTHPLLRVPAYNSGDYTKLLLAYQEFERASRGKRWMTWSRGAKKAFGIDEIEDAQITEFSEGEDGDALPLDAGTREIGGFTPDEWRRVARDPHNPIMIRQMLEEANTAPEAVKILSEDFAKTDITAIWGEEWDKRLQEIGDRQDREKAAKAANKPAKWESGRYVPEEAEAEVRHASGAWRWSDPEAVAAAAVEETEFHLWDDGAEPGPEEDGAWEYEAA